MIEKVRLQFSIYLQVFQASSKYRLGCVPFNGYGENNGRSVMLSNLLNLFFLHLPNCVQNAEYDLYIDYQG